MMPAFISELEKEAGIKDDLKAGTTKVLSALKVAPQKTGDMARKAIVKAQSNKVVGKAMELAADPLNTPDIGHAISNFSRMLGH